MLFSMFITAFLASTILPGGSEALLILFLGQAQEQWFELLIVATIGNALGSMTSYYLGYAGRWVKSPELIESQKYQYAVKLTQKFGNWVLLLAWLPILGDVLCLLAGWFKLPLMRSFLMIFIGKGLRYSLIILAYFQLLST